MLATSDSDVALSPLQSAGAAGTALHEQSGSGPASTLDFDATSGPSNPARADGTADAFLVRLADRADCRRSQ
jgi:hypothetical protein